MEWFDYIKEYSCVHSSQLQTILSIITITQVHFCTLSLLRKRKILSLLKVWCVFYPFFMENLECDLMSFNFFHELGKDWCNWVNCGGHAQRKSSPRSKNMRLCVLCICRFWFPQYSNWSIAGFKFAYDVWRWQPTWREEKNCEWIHPVWRFGFWVTDTQVIWRFWRWICCWVVEFKMVCHSWIPNLRVSWSKSVG